MTPQRWKKTCASLMAAAVALAALPDLLATPARAQFFFPFFDNRPPAPPRVVPSPHRDLRPQPKKPRPAAQHRAPAKTESKVASPKPEPPAVEAPPPPYEPQLLRLAEIMGALAVLQNVCASAGPDATQDGPQGAARDADVNAAQDAAWRQSMQNLMDSQEAGPARRERLAGAYNRGLRGYQYSYRHCTPSAELARSRFLDEGARLTHDISVHYKEN